jgi:ABC-type Fe3+ transport system permease subunit
MRLNYSEIIQAANDPAISGRAGWALTHAEAATWPYAAARHHRAFAVLVMISKSLFVQGQFSLKAYEALFASGGQQALLLGRSVILALLTSALATIAGVCLGILLGRSDLPGRITLASLFTVPLLLPPYVVAVAWFAVLGKGGWLSQALPSGIAEPLSTALFGLAGCTWVLLPHLC